MFWDKKNDLYLTEEQRLEVLKQVNNSKITALLSELEREMEREVVIGTETNQLNFKDSLNEIEYEKVIKNYKQTLYLFLILHVVEKYSKEQYKKAKKYKPLVNNVLNLFAKLTKKFLKKED